MPVTDPWLPAPDGDGLIPAGRNAVLIRVFRYSSPGSHEEMTNLRCLSVEEREGPVPSSAVFRYVFDGRDENAPQNSTEALSTLVELPKTVEIGDRLLVWAEKPDETGEWIFDGYPLDWSMQLHGRTEMVLMTATGVAKRCWDKPIIRSFWRDGDAAGSTTDVETDLIMQFNPRGIPNATAINHSSGIGDKKYPVFLDPLIVRSPAITRMWDLVMMARHILMLYNDEVFVKNPDFTELDDILVAREPIDEVTFDPNDPDTYTVKLITAADAPLTGHAWPTALHDQIKNLGFGFSFDLANDDQDEPETSLRIFLKQSGTVKQLLLQERGARFNPRTTNVGSAQLGRTLMDVVNKWSVHGALDRYEATFVLAPAFPSQASDATDENYKKYARTDPAFATSGQYNDYRTWVFDEVGDGHYTNASMDIINAPASLNDVLGEPDEHGPLYVLRRRPPIGVLFTKDTEKKPLRFRVAISGDYAGGYPAVWDGTGNWRPVTGFSLLSDRLGVRLNVDNPQKWNVGISTDENITESLRSEVLKVVQSIANPDAANPAFFVRLTCVIEADLALSQVAKKMDTSPLDQTIERVIDARDRYKREAIAPKSEFNSGDDYVATRDDSELAKAEAVSMRAATEAGVLEGEVTIPRFTRYYEIGDRIDQIEGRDLGLRTDSGGEDITPIYPLVVARRWDLDGGQRTVLTLSDQSLHSNSYRHNRHNVHHAMGPGMSPGDVVTP